MKLTGPKVLALALLVAGQVVVPSLIGAVPSADAAAFIPGSSQYQAVAPARLADTRPSEGAFGFERISDHVIRVQVAGQFGVPGNAAAAVLNVTGVNTTAPGFVTVYPAGTDLPTASNVNFDRAGQVMANMVTVKLGVGGAVDVYTQAPMDLVVDVSGAYVPVSAPVASGRLVTRADGAFRVLDTRSRGFGVAPGSTERVDVGAAGVPADAVAVVVNLTATETGLGFWTAFPLGQTVPNASNLNIDTAGQTRAGQAIVLLSGIPSFNVFSQGGGHLVVDVAGYFTSPSAPAATAGRFHVIQPFREVDSRFGIGFGRLPGGVAASINPSTVPDNAAAMAHNITIVDNAIPGFVTPYPGPTLPVVSAGNTTAAGQIHAVLSFTQLSAAPATMSYYTLMPTDLVVDTPGYFEGG